MSLVPPGYIKAHASGLYIVHQRLVFPDSRQRTIFLADSLPGAVWITCRNVHEDGECDRLGGGTCRSGNTCSW